MKIVFANNFHYLRGGSERVFFDEMELLRNAGHEVIPFSRQHEQNLPTQYSSYFPPPLDYENTSFQHKLSAGFELVYSRECGEKFGRLLDDVKPDIVHAHNIYGRLTTAILDAAKRRRVQVVMTLHDHKLICPSYLMLRNGQVCELCAGKSFYQCALTRCHKGGLAPSLVYTLESYLNRIRGKYDDIKYFICPSHFLKGKHAGIGIPDDRLVTIPNFIRPEKFEPAYGTGSYILFVGRLSREKGIITLLKAMQGVDVPLKVVGEGPQREEYEKFAHETGLTQVTFEGYKSGNDLARLYREALFLVFPSEWYENAPMTILEAFAHGKPVVGSDIGGIPEMVVNLDTGLLFRPGNSDDLKEQIRRLIGNPSTITQMGQAARSMVENVYNADRHYRELIKVYREAVA